MSEYITCDKVYNQGYFPDFSGVTLDTDKYYLEIIFDYSKAKGLLETNQLKELLNASNGTLYKEGYQSQLNSYIRQEAKPVASDKWNYLALIEFDDNNYLSFFEHLLDEHLKKINQLNVLLAGVN